MSQTTLQQRARKLTDNDLQFELDVGNYDLRTCKFTPAERERFCVWLDAVRIEIDARRL
jgi:hypothetical protein